MIDSDHRIPLPSVRRARGFRLYLHDGRRVVDLWQQGGNAILGHTPPGVLLSLKNTAARGLFSPFPSIWEKRFATALRRLHPAFPGVRFYPDKEMAQAALDRSGLGSHLLALIKDPACGEHAEKGQVILWRPWIGSVPNQVSPGDSAPNTHAPQSGEPCYAEASVLVPVIPLPFPGLPIAFLLHSTLESAFPPASTCSPLILAAATRALDDLLAELPKRDPSRFRRVDSVLAGGSGCWKRKGDYVSWFGEAGSYTPIWSRFMAGGFMLPPTSDSPLILPGELSDGEESALAALLAACV